jgi:hypothetical protein
MNSQQRDGSPQQKRLEEEFKKMYVREKELNEKIKEFEKLQNEQNIAGKLSMLGILFDRFFLFWHLAMVSLGNYGLIISLNRLSCKRIKQPTFNQFQKSNKVLLQSMSRRSKPKFSCLLQNTF